MARVTRRSFRRKAAGAAVLAVAAGAAFAQRSILDGALIEGMQLFHSRGEVLNEEIQSARSHVDDAGVSMLSHDIRMTIHGAEGGGSIVVTSPIARYYFATKEESTSAEPLPPMTGGMAADFAASVRILTDDPQGPAIAQPARGDVLLIDSAGTGGVLVDFGERGSLHVSVLYWSESRQRFICPGPFRQEATLPDGTMQITGEAFVADRTFTDWWYPSAGTAPVTFEFKGRQP